MQIWKKQNLSMFGLIFVFTMAFGHLALAYPPSFPNFIRDYPNLAYNPSFEIVSWLGPTFEPDWEENTQPQFWPDRPYTLRDTKPENARTGSCSLRVTGPVSNYIYQTLILRPNESYTMSAYVRTSGTLTAEGVRLGFYQINNPNSGLRGATPYVTNAENWTRIESDPFTLPSNHEEGSFRIDVRLNAGEVAWLDDLEIKPTSGVVDQAPSPTISAGGTFTGPQFVTLTTALNGAEIHYTMDNSTPNILASATYGAPFWLAGSATIKARVFHDGYQESEVIAEDFTILPATGEGKVPFYPVGWGQDVEDWWADHFYNPDSENHIPVGAITSPTPTRYVRDYKAGSMTGGIEEAIASLPAEGGTLIFTKADEPYVIAKETQTTSSYYTCAGSVLVLRRDNVHFIGDDPAGVRIVGRLPVTGGNERRTMMGFDSMDFADTDLDGPSGSALGQIQVPSRNFYFKNLIFDGDYDGSTDEEYAHESILFRHCSDVLFDNCQFENFSSTSDSGHGRLSATTKSDNVWFRNSRFHIPSVSGANRDAIYVDGVHNGGALNCEILESKGGMMIFTNNDMVYWSAEERTAQYFVIQNCLFEGSNAGYDCIKMTAANCLVSSNTVRPSPGYSGYRAFVDQQGRGESNIRPWLLYSGNGVKIVDNVLENSPTGDVDTLCILTNYVSQWSRWSKRVPTEIRGNRCTDVNNLVVFDVKFPDPVNQKINATSLIEDVLISNNHMEAELTAQVRLNDYLADPWRNAHVTSVTIENNYFAGTPRNFLVANNATNNHAIDADGPIQMPGVVVRNNLPTPPAPSNVQKNGENTYSWTDNGTDTHFFRIYFSQGTLAGDDYLTTTTGTSWTPEVSWNPEGTYAFQVTACYPFLGESGRTPVLVWNNRENGARHWEGY